MKTTRESPKRNKERGETCLRREKDDMLDCIDNRDPWSKGIDSDRFFLLLAELRWALAISEARSTEGRTFMSNMGSSSSLRDADAGAVPDADEVVLLLLFIMSGCSLSENASRVGDCETLGENCDEKWEGVVEVVEEKDPLETWRRCWAAC